MKKVLYFILGIILAMVALIAVCAINPGLSDKLGEYVNKARGIEMSGKMSGKLTEELDISSVANETDDNSEQARTMEGTEEADINLPDDMSDFSRTSLPSDNVSSVTTDDMSEEVANMSDFELPTSSVEVLDEVDISKDRNDMIEVGDTGEEYAFDPLFYPYYSMLEDNEQAVYRQIYANAFELCPKFRPVEDITEEELTNIYLSVILDHPEIFWLDNDYSGKKNRMGVIVEIDLEFNRTADNLEEEKKRFENEANSIILNARNYASEYEMEKYVHDVLAERITYVTGAELNQNAYSALINGETVCAGYARSFQYIMQELGIPCYMCVGYAGESHAWDIVLLDGDYYNVDVTWDDTSTMTYNYFNKTDSDYLKDHKRNSLSVYLPDCDGEKYRNLETNPYNSEIRTVEDTGIDEDLIFDDIDSYYEYCYDEMIRLGEGENEFSCIIVGRELLEEITEDFQSNKYRKAYMKPALNELGAKKCSIDVSGEILQDDSYLLIHKVVIK